MSPPIRDGSGNSIGSIRLGDGSEIAEVRTGAGDVVFSANTLPDSGLQHYYDAAEITGLSNGQTVDPFNDDTANNENLSATNSPAYQSSTINGEPGVVYTRTNDDFHSKPTFNSGFPSDPVQIWVVYNPTNSLSSAHGLFTFPDSNTSPSPYLSEDFGNNRFSVRDSGGSTSAGGSPSSVPKIILVRYTGSNTQVAVDGSDIINGGNGTLNASGMYQGTRDAGTGRTAGGEIPFSAVYDSSDANYSETDVLNYLSNRFGISVP